MKKIAIFFIIIATATPAHAGDFNVALGIASLLGGQDFQVNYRPEQSHWQFGYRYISWTDTFEDPFTGRELTETSMTYTGPIVSYLLDIDSSETYYLGASLFQWSSTEKSLITSETDSESVIAPFFGGGYTSRMGESAYYNLGAFISGTRLKTETSVSSSETLGLDLQLQVGIVF